MHPNQNMFETAIGIVFFLVGVVTLGIAVIDCIRGFRARHWATVEAVILDRDIKTQKGRRTWFVPTVRYRYQVEGRTYESNRIMFGHLSTTDRNDAERFMSYFEIGKNVPVYMSRVHPHVSVVKPGVDNQIWFRIVWASFAAFIGAGLVLQQLK